MSEFIKDVVLTISKVDSQINELVERRDELLKSILDDIELSVGDDIEITGYSHSGKEGRIEKIVPIIHQRRDWSSEKNITVPSNKYDVAVNVFVNVLKADGTESKRTSNMKIPLGTYDTSEPETPDATLYDEDSMSF